MPQGDKTGPEGKGSMTGRSTGPCNEATEAANLGNTDFTPRGRRLRKRQFSGPRGFGRGFGGGRRPGSVPLNNPTTAALSAEVKSLKKDLREIKETLSKDSK